MESLKLTGSLDIGSVGRWKELLQPGLEAGALKLEARTLGRADSAGFQLLYAFVQAMRAKGGTVVWAEPSRALLEGAALLGLTEELGLGP